MIYKKVLSTILITGLILITGCQLNEHRVQSEGSDKSNLDNSTDKTDIEMKIIDGNNELPVEAVELEITNHGENEYTYGSQYTVEKYVDQSWSEIPFKDNVGFNMILYTLKPNNTNQQTIYLKLLDHQLDKGKYRIKKDFTKNKTNTTLTAEFELN
ncbi:immunoglobulin-like domain-containing protein [Pseudalkalibacillus sp. R45]|uniref:immunoglobulin-like domain-containing protein n=1 Tax=Pseudalkalibacillus sp. R45 TaxID=3457433 RepID=UPI003FCE05FB